MAKIMGRQALGASPRVQSQRGVSSYRPIVAPAGGAGEAGAMLAAAGDDIARKFVADKMDADLAAAKTEYSRRKLALLDGDGENEAGYRNVMGQAALDGFKGYKGKLEGLRGEVGGTLGGRVAQMFNAWAKNEELNAQGLMVNHLGGQRKVVLDATDAGFVDQMTQEIVANPLDDKLVKQRGMEIMQRTSAMLDRKGITDPTAREVVMRQALTKAHSGAIDRLLAADDPEAASAYLEKHRGQIDQLQIAAIEKSVRGHAVTKQAQEVADEALARFSNEAEALAWVRQKYEGKVEDTAVAEVTQRFGEQDRALARQDRAEARADRDALERGQAAADGIIKETANETEALARIAETMDGKEREYAEDEVREHYSSLDRERARGEREAVDTAQTYVEGLDLSGASETEAIAKAEGDLSGSVQEQAVQMIRQRYASQARAEADQQKDLRASATQKAYAGQLDTITQPEREAMSQTIGGMERLQKVNENVIRGLPQVSDEPTRQSLVKMATERPLAFANVDLYGPDLVGKLNDTDLGYFERLKMSINKDDAKARRVSRINGITRNLVKDAKLNDEAKASLEWQIMQRLDEIETDKPITDKDIREIAMGLMIQGENPGSVFDEDVRALEAGPQFYMGDFADENEATIKEFARSSGVAESRVGVILEALLRAGRPTTAAEIQAIDAKLKAQGK